MTFVHIYTIIIIGLRAKHNIQALGYDLISLLLLFSMYLLQRICDTTHTHVCTLTSIAVERVIRDSLFSQMWD